MAKRESIWKANDGTEHRSKQSAAVADAEEAIRVFVDEHRIDDADDDEPEAGRVYAADIIAAAPVVSELVGTLIKARAALAKHEAKGE